MPNKNIDKSQALLNKLIHLDESADKLEVNLVIQGTQTNFLEILGLQPTNPDKRLSKYLKLRLWQTRSTNKVAGVQQNTQDVTLN